MKYQKDQEVILLAMDGKPAKGKAVILQVKNANGTYTVAHYLNDAATPEEIGNIPEGRIITYADIVRAALNVEGK